MKARPPRHIVSLVALLIFLLTGQAAVQGYVLCLGEDGDAALEFVGGNSCAPVAQEQGQACRGEGLSGLSPEEHCGPCTDLSVSFDPASQRNQDQDDLSLEQTGFTAIAQGASVPSFIRVLSAKLFPNPPPRESQTILAHRTVVLLN